MNVQAVDFDGGLADIVPSSLLATVDEVFVTNSLLGVMPVARNGDHCYDLDANSGSKAAMTAYRAFEIPSGSQRVDD